MDEAKCAYAGKTINQVHHSLHSAWLEGSWWSIPRLSRVCWGGGRSQEPSLLTVMAWVLHSLHGARGSVGLGSTWGTVFSGHPLGCTCVCTHTAHMYEFAWDGGDVMEKQCWGTSALTWPSHSHTCARYRRVWGVTVEDFRNKFPVPLWRVASSHMVLEQRLVSSFQTLVWGTSASFAAPRTSSGRSLFKRTQGLTWWVKVMLLAKLSFWSLRAQGFCYYILWPSVFLLRFVYL